MNIRTEEFKAGHIEALDPIEQIHTPEEWRQVAEYNEKTSIGLTAFVGDKIMACGGIRLHDYCMWVVIDKSAVNHKKEMFYAGQTFIKILTEQLETDTINCHITPSFTEGVRFVSHLGFEPTGRQNKGFDIYELKLERAAA